MEESMRMWGQKVIRKDSSDEWDCTVKQTRLGKMKWFLLSQNY